MKKVINQEDIRKANNIERCKLLIAIIKRTSSIHTRHKSTQIEEIINKLRLNSTQNCKVI